MKFKKQSQYDEAVYMSLLLIGDEQESMIRRYLDDGELYTLEVGGELVCVAVMVQVDEKTCELKNLAVWPSRQGKGCGSAMLQYLTALYAGRCETMLLGTGETPRILSFYHKAGFRESHRIVGFFTDNYDHLIIEDGVTLKDMIYLSKRLLPQLSERQASAFAQLPGQRTSEFHEPACQPPDCLLPVDPSSENQLAISPLARPDWPEVAAVYQLGIDTKIAAFRPEVPGWVEWDSRHLTHSRLSAKMDGCLVGWAALSPASDKDYYKGVVEISIYVAPWSKGRGVGKALLTKTIEEAERNGIWTIESKIIAENEASLALHKRCGFEVVGRRTRLGRMDDGTWHDIYLLDYRSRVNGWD